MTLAPRVQVFTQLSCNAIYGHDVYDHTSLPLNFTAVTSPHSFHIPLHASLDPLGPHIDRRSMEPSILIFPASDRDEASVVATSVSYYTSPATDDDDDDEPDPRALPSRKCLSDPRVQAGAAKIQTIMTTTMGLLSALTTGWWGHFGEQYGRTRVLAAATLGLFLTDLVFILVSTPHSAFAAHGHKLLIVSPIIEGLLGGWSTLQGATSAYISDCTSDGSRAHIFSRFAGVFYLGFSLGPAIGAYLIRHPLFSFPSNSSGYPGLHNGQPVVTSVFYVAAMCSFVNLLLVLFVFPESLDKKRAKEGIQRAAMSGHGGVEATAVGKQSFCQRLLSPLALFAPKKITTPEGGYRRDWSLTILGLVFFSFLLSTGIVQIKYLYAEHMYEWNAEKLSYYITFVGALRAVHLLFIMPHIIATFKPKPKPKQPQSAPSSVAAHHGSSSQQQTATVPVHAKKTKQSFAHLVKEMKFDVLLLRCSFFIDFLSHTLVALSPPDASQALFVAFTGLNSLGAGVQPAVSSVALCIIRMQQQASGQSNGEDDGGAGTLFGAFASLQSVGQMILGPLIFGMIYSSTVATFPKAIFVMAAGILLTALVLLCLLRPDVSLRVKQQRRSREDEELERGRSRISKDLGRSSPALSDEPSGSVSSRSM
ncbi:MFS general substrate transporter [Trametopsis cervina]|nr:MFS general substrate transporter [Trametopsis cervina]